MQKGGAKSFCYCVQKQHDIHQFVDLKQIEHTISDGTEDNWGHLCNEVLTRCDFTDKFTVNVESHKFNNVRKLKSDLF